MLLSEAKSTGHFLSATILPAFAVESVLSSTATGLSGAKSAVLGLMNNGLSPKNKKVADSNRHNTIPIIRKNLFFTRSLPYKYVTLYKADITNLFMLSSVAVAIAVFIVLFVIAFILRGSPVIDKA